MSNFLGWISKNPSAFASLVGAIIAASVALSVFAITQLLTGRRERTQFLSPKLEELYLLLNKVAEDNTKFFKIIYLILEGNSEASKELASMDDLELYGHRAAKQMIMYIRLYFPSLSRIHQFLFSAQRDLNQLIFQLHTETPPDYKAVELAAGRVGHFLRLMEGELIQNRDNLLGDYTFRKRYRETGQVAIDAENPAPEGPVMNLPPREA